MLVASETQPHNAERYPVIGGKSDASLLSTTQVVVTLRGDEKYIAIEFKARPRGSAEKPRLYRIFMKCGMTPEQAMQIYRQRFMMETT